MKRLIKSCLNQTDSEVVDVLQDFKEEAKHYKKVYYVKDVIKDEEMQMIDFIITSYNNAKQTPSLAMLELSFPAFKGTMDSVVTLNVSDLRTYMFNLVDARVNKYISQRMSQLNGIIMERGITPDIEDEFDKLRTLSNRNKAKEVDISMDIRSIYQLKKSKPQGMITGIKAVDDKIGGMNEGTVTTIAGFTSQYKCVSEKERVLTNLGLLTMKEIYQYGIGKGLMVQSEFGMKKLVAVHDEGVKKSYIVSIGGVPIETSPVHRFRVLTSKGLEWVEAQNIKVGDKIVQSLKDSYHDGEYDDKDFWRLYGQLCGDGGVTINGDNSVCACLGGVTENLEFMESERLFSKFFKSYSVTNCSSVKKGYLPPRLIRASLNYALRDEFKDFIGKKARTKEFPSKLYYKSRDCWEAFILGLYETDGCSGDNMGFTMSNKDFLLGVSKLLSAMGISSVITYTGTKNDSYHLRVAGSYSKNKFMRIVKRVTFKASNKSEFSEVEDKTRLFPTREEFVRFKRGKYTRADYRNFKSFCHKDENKTTNYYTIRRVCESYNEFMESAYFKEILDAELTWNKVTSIEQSECYMYDLTVEGSPTYLLNGYVTHNTTFALNIARTNAYSMGYNIAYISLETPKEDMMWNLLSCHSYSPHLSRYTFVGHDRMRKAIMTEDEEDFIFNVVKTDLENDYIDKDGQTKHRGKIVFLDESNFDTFSFGEITGVLQNVDKQLGGKLDAVIVDYAQLCKFSGGGYTEDANSMINSYVTFFRRIAQNFKKEKDPVTGEEKTRQLIMIILSQINRTSWRRATNNEGRYDLTCLADANELERGSYRVFTTFTNEDLKGRKSAQVQILKNRTGQTMYEPCSVYADGESYTFCDEEGMNTTFGGDQSMNISSAFSSLDDSDLSGLGI